MIIHHVIVTYNPNIGLLSRAINSIVDQVDMIYIIDNSAKKYSFLSSFENIKIIVVYLAENMGIAYAQNIGIYASLVNNPNYIVLSDQDTIYPSNYIGEMLKCFDVHEKVAAVAPQIFDFYQNINQGFVKKSLFGFRKFYPSVGKHEIFHAIASGKILNVKYLQEIGLMNESLFIDWVDYDWCWRVHTHKLTIIGNADIVICHKLGVGESNLVGKHISQKNSLRYYYITRNAIYLSLRTRDLDLIHKISLFIRSFRYIIGYPLLFKPRLLNLKYVSLGFYHGIVGRLGGLKNQFIS
jgi:rhamnosyltransferase